MLARALAEELKRGNLRVATSWIGGSPETPVEMRPLRELIQVPASLIVEAGSPQAFSCG